MNVLATFSDGSILEVTGSSRVTDRSSNTNVAAVDRDGAIRPIGIGRASVTATYANGDRNVRIAIPVSVPELLLTVSSHSLTFDEQTIATTSAPEQLMVTNTSTGPIKVIKIETESGEDFAETDNCFASTPLPVGASCTILVSFKPAEAGQTSFPITLMTDHPRVNEVTGLLLSWRQGDAAALDRLVPLVYDGCAGWRAVISGGNVPDTRSRRRLSCTRSSCDSWMRIA